MLPARISLITMPIFAGLWTISPNGSEIFIPQSLLRFEIRELDPASPPALPMLPIPSHANVPTLLCEPILNIRFLQSICLVWRLIVWPLC